MTMTKAKMTELLLERFEIRYDECYRFVDMFFKELTDAVVAEHELKLAGLGSFHVLAKKSRPGRNPKTGEPYEVSARKSVSFTLSPKLKEKLLQLSSSD